MTLIHHLRECPRGGKCRGTGGLMVVVYVDRWEEVGEVEEGDGREDIIVRPE